MKSFKRSSSTTGRFDSLPKLLIVLLEASKASSDLTMLYHYLSEKRKKDDYLIIHPNTNIEDIKSLLKEHQYRIIYLEDENISDSNYLFELILQYRKNNIALYDIVESNNLENYMKNYNVGKCLIR